VDEVEAVFRLEVLATSEDWQEVGAVGELEVCEVVAGTGVGVGAVAARGVCEPLGTCTSSARETRFVPFFLLRPDVGPALLALRVALPVFGVFLVFLACGAVPTASSAACRLTMS
jgi:hypothetical protein